MTRSPSRGEAGVSLLETLVALFLVSVSFIGIIGGMLVTASATNTNTDVAAVESALQVAADDLKARVITDVTTYQPCAATYSLISVPDVTLTVTSVDQWDGTSFAGACIAPPADDSGVQQVTIEASSQKIDVVKSGVVVLRNPAAGPPVTVP